MDRAGLFRISAILAFSTVAALYTPAFAQQKAGGGGDVFLPKPSENKGKTGQYQVKTSKEGYNYFVYVPKSYSEDNPAGLNIQFHGQGGHAGAMVFPPWSKYFLEDQNMIGINMQYMDGDNAKDTSGKVAAAREAIAQVMADYKIIPGRGAIGSFSGGGLPHSEFMTKYGKQGPMAWPFIHSALYDSNFWIGATGGPQMSWFIALGEKEWDAGKPTLGTTQTARFNELLGAGVIDSYMKVVKDKGHVVTGKDVEDSAKLFHITDIVIGPFVYLPDYPQKELAPIAVMANNQEIGKASAAIEKLLKDGKLSDEAKQKAEKLKGIIDKRADAKIELMKQLGQDDPPIFAYHAKRVESQFAGHPKLADLKQIIADAQKTDQYKAALNAYSAFAKIAPSAFSSAKLTGGAATALEKLKESTPENSFVGKMIREFLELK